MSNFPREPSPMGPKPDCRSGDLVSRLLAATPPYLYNIPVGPQNFFFSEMLRGFVHARAGVPPKDAGLSLAPPPPPSSRRGRKRSWKEAAMPKPCEPLELTTKTSPPPQLPPRQHSPAPVLPPLPTPTMLGMQPDLPLPLPPRLGPDLMINPLWFPHLYPPVPPHFDPLNFLMDLRTGAGAWDGKTAPELKDTPEEPLNLQVVEDKKIEPSLGFPFFKQRQSSAFRVPQPRPHLAGQRPPTPTPGQTKSTNYILQNLQKIYIDIKKEGQDQSPEPEPESTRDVTSCSAEEGAGGEGDAEGGKKCKDLRALIGLELVVDYVKKGDKPRTVTVGQKLLDHGGVYYVKDEQEQDLEMSDSTDESFSHHSGAPSPQGLGHNNGGSYLM